MLLKKDTLQELGVNQLDLYLNRKKLMKIIKILIERNLFIFEFNFYVLFLIFFFND